jgi:hypothetical protein
MGLSVTVFMQLAASGELHGLHGAAFFFYLPQQTLPVLGEIPPGIQLSVLLHPFAFRTFLGGAWWW